VSAGRRDDDDWRVPQRRIGAHLAHDRVTVHLRQHQIQEDEVGRLLA
jgi:hypothetical protein